jgi:hypothetical protein
MSLWQPCKRREFIKRLRKLDFDGPYSGTRHQFMIFGEHRLAIDFQIINFTRPEGGDNTGSISPTDNAVKLFMWKSISHQILNTQYLNYV